MAEDPTDEMIEERLRSASADRWNALWHSADALLSDGNRAKWAGGEQTGTTVVDGTERRVFQMPYVVYSTAVSDTISCLYRLGAIVPFRWMDWGGSQRYRGGDTLEDADVADAVRMLTGIVRSDRFCEGTIKATLEDGTFLAAMQRLLRWYDQERAAGRVSGPMPSANE